jgi:AmmeMemoRadiSam system protein A
VETAEVTDQQGSTLPTLARQAVAEALGEGRLLAPDEGWLFRPGATFVTLTRGGALRGCIGSLYAVRPLLDDLAANARAAAFADPRFPPLTAEELPSTRFEVSLLTPPRPLAVAGEEDLLDRLVPGVDGLLLEWREHRGIFLPQMWEQLPEPRRFVAHLKRKARLEETFWDRDVRCSVFAVRKWAEH